jgi:hypothetical protein
MGKDSIASYIQLKRYFKNVHNVFYFMIPDLKFQRDSLDYYEQKFGEKIHIIPSPHFYIQLTKLMYQSPERINAIDNLILDGVIFIPTHDQLFSWVKDDLKLSQDTYVATGVRRDDSLTRRLSIKKTGAENVKRKQFFPVFDWSISKIRQDIADSGIKLPIDYKIWGRTFDGVQYSFLKGMRDNFPDDYETIKFWFPLCEIDFLRIRDFTTNI